MKIIFILILSFLLPEIISGHDEKYELSLIVKNIRNNKGQVAVQLLNEEENVIEARYISIKDKIASTIFHNISPGKYAIKIFHDENRNEKMDLNWLGIPKEGFGFSVNPEITFGQPDIEEFLFQVDTDTETIINMVYFP
jgi:uncharacterized protein (DUF2141 family)